MADDQTPGQKLQAEWLAATEAEPLGQHEAENRKSLYDKDGYEATAVGNPPREVLGVTPKGGRFRRTYEEWATLVDRHGGPRLALEAIDPPPLFDQEYPVESPPIGSATTSGPTVEHVTTSQPLVEPAEPTPEPTPPVTSSPAPITSPPVPTGSSSGSKPGGGKTVVSATDAVNALLGAGKAKKKKRDKAKKAVPHVVQGIRDHFKDEGLEDADIDEVLRSTLGEAGKTESDESIKLPGIPEDSEILEHDEAWAVAMDGTHPRIYHKSASKFQRTSTSWSDKSAFERDLERADWVLADACENKRGGGQSKSGGKFVGVVKSIFSDD